MADWDLGTMGGFFCSQSGETLTLAGGGGGGLLCDPAGVSLSRRPRHFCLLLLIKPITSGLSQLGP